jgi:hypothetical protein
MRAEISFLQRPSVPAPRRMRRTLYCCWVMSNWRSNLSAVFDSSEAVRRMLRNASCCKETKGRFCLSVTAKGDLLVVAIVILSELHPQLTIPLTGEEAGDGLRHRTEVKAVSLESSPSRSVTLPLVADGQLATLVSRCLDLIY